MLDEELLFFEELLFLEELLLAEELLSLEELLFLEELLLVEELLFLEELLFFDGLELLCVCVRELECVVVVFFEPEQATIERARTATMQITMPRFKNLFIEITFPFLFQKLFTEVICFCDYRLTRDPE